MKTIDNHNYKNYKDLSKYLKKYKILINKSIIYRIKIKIIILKKEN